MIIGVSPDTDSNFGTVSSHIEPSTWILQHYIWNFTFFGYCDFIFMQFEGVIYTLELYTGILCEYILEFYSGLDFTLVLKEVFFHVLVLRSLSLYV